MVRWQPSKGEIKGSSHKLLAALLVVVLHLVLKMAGKVMQGSWVMAKHLQDHLIGR